MPDGSLLVRTSQRQKGRDDDRQTRSVVNFSGVCLVEDGPCRGETGIEERRKVVAVAVW